VIEAIKAGKPAMADVLVVYYSRSGATEGVARDLAGKLGADLDVIRPQADYAGANGFRRGVWHSMVGRTPRVGSDRDPAGYSLVILGSPVWAGKPSAPARSYLKAHRGHIKTLAAFCVSGSGQRYDNVFREVARLAGCPLAGSLSLAERDARDGALGPRLEPFLASLRVGERVAA